MKKSRADKVKHIIDIATELFSEKGYYGTLTDDVAERAGISKRSMYYYVGDKDMLYETVFNRLMDQFSNVLYADTNNAQSPVQQLSSLIRGIANVAKIRPLHTIMIRKLFAGGGTVPARAFKDTDKMLETFSSICAELRSDDGQADVSPVIVGWMVFALFVYWDSVIPFVYASEGNTQREAIDAIGVDVNGNVVKEVEKLVFRMLNLKEAS